jgi:hypothetical protein
MKKKIVKSLSILIVIVVGYFIFQILNYIIAPDIPINTPPQIREIVQQKLPHNYEIQSISSVQRISEFEGLRTPEKWLKITLKNKTITDEKELYKIAEPICYGIGSIGYEGLDISPNNTLQSGTACGIWGP